MSLGDADEDLLESRLVDLRFAALRLDLADEPDLLRSVCCLVQCHNYNLGTNK